MFLSEPDDSLITFSFLYPPVKGVFKYMADMGWADPETQLPTGVDGVVNIELKY